MKDWIKWGLAGAAIGFVIEVLTFGYVKFFWLEPKLEDAIGILLFKTIGIGYLPGEAPILILTLYFIMGVILGKIISQYRPKRG